MEWKEGRGRGSHVRRRKEIKQSDQIWDDRHRAQARQDKEVRSREKKRTIRNIITRRADASLEYFCGSKKGKIEEEELHYF